MPALAMRRAIVALLVCACSVHGRSLLVDGDLSSNSVLPQADDAYSARASSSSWMNIARCVLAPSPLDCVEARSESAVEAMLSQMSEARATKDETALEPEVVDKVAELGEVIVDAAASVLERKMGFQDETEELVEEGRKKKKKKIHKLIALVKLVLLVLVVKLKLAFLMMAMQTLFQFKIMAMVFLILLTKKIGLWAQLKAAKTHDAQKVIVQHEGGKHSSRFRSSESHFGDREDFSVALPRAMSLSLSGPGQQVIYYEHAQHQHHYDDHGGWASGGGHEEHADAGHHGGGGGGGGWGGLWGRSYETTAQAAQGAQAPVQVSSPGAGVHSGVYRAADGTRIVVGPQDAQDMAYSAQRP